MILFIHHRYRLPGGEERAAQDLARVVREQLGEETVLLERDSARLRPAAAAAGLIGGGLAPDQVAQAVRATGARIVHAHNLHPTFGWRALAAARAAGARTVLHLHQYRLVCAIGVCFRDGRECLECHGTDTLPGVRHNCRGSRGESLAYGAGLALWQRRTVALADAVVVPSAFAAARLRELGAPLGNVHIVPNVVRELAEGAAATGNGEAPRDGALVVSRLAPEKGVDIAIDACARAGIGLTIAGDGPDRASLEAHAAATGAAVRFLGRVPERELADLRARAAVGVAASRSAETFGLAAAEAMAAGLPVAASRIGALPELVPESWLAPPGDPAALAAVLARLAADPQAGARAREHVRERAAPDVVAGALRDVYAAATR
jgi:glycosyltransferase involved in cell wall biosynthesis